jgi:hypothetical protein
MFPLRRLQIRTHIRKGRVRTRSNLCLRLFVRPLVSTSALKAFFNSAESYEIARIAVALTSLPLLYPGFQLPHRRSCIPSSLAPGLIASHNLTSGNQRFLRFLRDFCWLISCDIPYLHSVCRENSSPSNGKEEEEDKKIIAILKGTYII